jgi:uncharacterized membrane protein YcaP (DUF421 family)
VEELSIIILRTALLYVLILIIFRVMGKREIGELSLLDLVVFIMIAEIAVLGIEDPKDPFIHTAGPMLLLMLIQLVSAWLSLKSQKVRSFVEGRPTIIINQGRIDEKAMKSQRYNFDDLLVQLREKDINNIADVEYAILEPSGRLSVFKKRKNSIKENSFTLPLILDGKIQQENLSKINQTIHWLKEELKKKGYENIEDISFCSYQNGEFYIDEKGADSKHRI